MTAEPATTPMPRPWLLIWRGLTRRCPVCGQGHLFRRWFSMVERCPRCGLRFERLEGHSTGAVGINTVVSFGCLLIVLLGGFLITYPDVPAVGLLAACALVAIGVPIFFFPFSKTLWLALDLQFRPLEPDELSEGYRR